MNSFLLSHVQQNGLSLTIAPSVQMLNIHIIATVFNNNLISYENKSALGHICLLRHSRQFVIVVKFMP